MSSSASRPGNFTAGRHSGIQLRGRMDPAERDLRLLAEYGMDAEKQPRKLAEFKPQILTMKRFCRLIIYN